jgi:hypothetical protein
MGIHQALCPDNAKPHLKDAKQLLAPVANRSMPLLGFKPGKYQQQNEAALQEMQDDFQYGKKTA